MARHQQSVAGTGHSSSGSWDECRQRRQQQRAWPGLTAQTGRLRAHAPSEPAGRLLSCRWRSCGCRSRGGWVLAVCSQHRTLVWRGPCPWRQQPPRDLSRSVEGGEWRGRHLLRARRGQERGLGGRGEAVGAVQKLDGEGWTDGAGRRKGWVGAEREAGPKKSGATPPRGGTGLLGRDQDLLGWSQTLWG